MHAATLVPQVAASWFRDFMIAPDDLEKTVAELASRPKHEKVRALVHRLLTDALGADSTQIDFERRVPEVKGRIDALLGRTVIEIKSDLRRELSDAKHQLARYLPQRELETGQRYVGLATDGAEFIAYETDGDDLRELTRHETKRDKPRNLVAWLEGVVAVQDRVPADALNIINELGRESTAFARLSIRLASAWSAVRHYPEAALKRQLWARHMGSVYGDESKLIQDDKLWLQHTYLVTVAKAIAAGAMGFDGQSPQELLDGSRFDRAGVRGAVEEDFFGWILHAPDGERIVELLVQHAARFDLGDIQVDLLKVLYENLIDPEQRHDLGEYYTPDWLAAKVVRNVIQNAATDRVLDPSCGSGTFLFQTLRLKRAALERKGVPLEEMAAILSEQVFGFDVHPVAVIFARVTYLLGLGPALARRREFVVPVFLGDALQWNVRRDQLEQDLIVEAPADPAEPLFGPTTLRFPLSMCERTADFDRLTELMDHSAELGRSPEAFAALASRQGAKESELRTLEDTYDRFKRLRDQGRDHIWTYVARNLSRPIAVSQGRKMDVIVGNPPWLSYRFMSRSMQKRFRDSSKALGVWVTGKDEGKLVTQMDLSGLFFARTVQLYLRPPEATSAGGRIAMVLPLAAMTRGQFRGFRSGSWDAVHVAFDRAWVLDNQDIQPLFRVPTCVLFATRSVMPKPIPTKATTFVGRLPSGRKDATEAEAARYIQVYATDAPAIVTYKAGSPYRDRFRQGATLVPRMLCLVERQDGGRLGVSSSAPVVRSKRSTQEKQPWRDLPSLEGSVEAAFLRPVLLGESIAPYRVLGASEGVIPMLPGGDMLNSDAAARRGLPQLSNWLERAEQLWRLHSAGARSLADRWNYQRGLSNQAGSGPIRVVFSKSGTLPAAAIVRDPAVVIDHVLYWAPTATLGEAQYLEAVLNSEAARRRVERLQARGEQGARHFDKLFFTLPIPRFDVRDALHQKLAQASVRAEKVAGDVLIDPVQPFTRSRSLIRQRLADTGSSAEIDALVEELLGPDETATLAPSLQRRNPAVRNRMLDEARVWIERHRDDPAEQLLAEEVEYVQSLNGLEP